MSIYVQNTSHKIITGKEAKERGLKRYFTGKPCKYGHIAERWVSKGSCVLCVKERLSDYRRTPEFRAKERERRRTPEYRAKNRERKRTPEYKAKDRGRQSTPEYRANQRERNRINAARHNGYARAPLEKDCPPRPEICDCCHKPSTKTLHLDHCHVTGEFMGWVCIFCNSLRDDITALQQRIDYLRAFQSRQVEPANDNETMVYEAVA
jgi:hypothetical protein